MTQKQYNPRRTFSIKGQLVGKLGQQGFGQLLQDLAAVTGPAKAEKGGKVERPKRRRRGGRGRKPQAVVRLTNSDQLAESA